MAKRVTLYISDEDAPLVEQFKKGGGNLSEALREQLHRWQKLEAMRGDLDLIELSMDPPQSNKKFFGKWIYVSHDEYGNIVLGVAHTRGGRFLEYWSRYEHGDSGYLVHDSIDAIKDPVLRYRSGAALTDGAEFLDI